MSEQLDANQQTMQPPTLLELYHREQILAEQQRQINEDIAYVREGIAAHILPDGQQRFQSTGKEFGTMTFTRDDGFKCKVDFGKKVEWDQEKLAEIRAKITAANDNPDQYMAVETKTVIKVSETKYNAWPDALKRVFDSARTVTPAAPKVSIIEKVAA